MWPDIVLFIGLLNVAASVIIIKHLPNMVHAMPDRCHEHFLLKHGSLVLHEQHTRLKIWAGAAMKPTGKSTGSGVAVGWWARHHYSVTFSTGGSGASAALQIIAWWCARLTCDSKASNVGGRDGNLQSFTSLSGCRHHLLHHYYLFVTISHIMS